MSSLADALAEATTGTNESDDVYARLHAETTSAWSDPAQRELIGRALELLVRRELNPQLAALIGASLAEIGGEPARGWEDFASTDFWREVFLHAPAETTTYFVRRRIKNARVILALADIAATGHREYENLAAAALSRAVQRSDVFSTAHEEAPSTWNAMASRFGGNAEMLAAADTLRRRLAAEGEASDNPRLDDVVAVHGLDRDRAVALLQQLASLQRAVYFQDSFRQALPLLHAKLGEVAPQHLAEHLVASARHRDRWKPLELPRMVGWPTITPELAAPMRSFLGRVAALEAADRQIPVAQLLDEYGERYGRRRFEQLGAGSIEVFSSAAHLWTALVRVHEYQRSPGDAGRDGARLRAESAAQADPVLWADCLEDLLEVSPDLDGLVEAITVGLSSHPSIDTALLRLSEHARDPRIVERAIALRTCIAGLAEPNDKTARTLLSIAAGLVDGRPIFPVPLALRSSTWLTATGLEHHLRDSIKRSALKFAEHARDQGRGEEEGLTAALLKELEFAFRAANPQLVATASKPVAMPGVSLAQKVVPKPIENVWGCDLSLLLSVDVPGVILDRAELVQVKKSQALMATPSASNIWKIESKQLRDLLARSATASYWLIAGDGEVLVVPATFLLGLATGSHRQRQKTFNVSYDQVRSTAQPLEHYLVDLFLGLWVGGQSKELLAFARGKELGMRPRNIVQIDVKLVFPDRVK